MIMPSRSKIAPSFSPMTMKPGFAPNSSSFRPRCGVRIFYRLPGKESTAMRAAPVLAMTAFLLGSGCRTDRRPGEAPDISLKTYGGEAYSVTARDGLVTLLVFWATWCRPCIMEIPTLMELHEKYRGRGFRVVAVN